MSHTQEYQHSHEKRSGLKRDRLEARVPKEQKSLFQKAADLQGKTLTEFLINSAQQEALRTIREYEIITLGKEDQRIFMEALLNYEVPNEALRSAAKQYFEAN
ncbi:MAG: DUF1778 domain-containing protein [Alphaproteobacteria bacterium]|jgi:uncharacterized protein (DUF1778 family)|nr:DUF1778 domain-containing protein [Alphaproteobacteria bacterium]